MSEREKFEDAERRKFEAVARAICTASGSLPNQQMPLGGSMWMFYEDEARAAIQAVKPFYGPVIVHPDSSPDEMNLLYGEAYGVDWEYPPKAPRADQAAEIAALRTELEEARKLLMLALYHHQGGGSPVGQPIRKFFGMDQFSRLTPTQMSEVESVAAIDAAKETS